jgi:hypothetical protein
MFLSFESRLPAEVGSEAATWHQPRLSERRAPVLQCTSRHQWAVDHRNKEEPSCPRHAAELVCVQSTIVYYRGVCKVCGHAATVRFNIAMQSQLTTLGHGYSGDMTR